MISATQPGDQRRLESWKEIANYLKREVRTVQRWEREEHLPVHRLNHKKQGSVYAYRTELDAWMEEREGHPRGKPPVQRPGSPFLVWRRLVLAVLPLQNLSADIHQEYFSDGLTDELITRIACLQQQELAVIARTSVMRYKHTDKAIGEIGRELAADFIIEGSVRREGDRVRITVQLIKVSDQAHVWAHSYERALSGVLAIQSDVARRIAESIRINLAPEQDPCFNRPIIPEAYEAYLRGRQEFNGWSRTGYTRAIACFEQAIAHDPAYALAYSWLAHSYSAMAFFGYMPPSYAAPRAKDSALTAVGIDPLEPEAHLALAWPRFIYDWDLDGAEEEFQKGLVLSPNSPMAHWGYAWYLTSRQEWDRAMAEMQRALELDPFNPFMNTSLGDILVLHRCYEDALKQYQQTLERVPGFSWAYELMGQTYACQGKYQEALAAHYEYEKVLHSAEPQALDGPIGVAAGQDYWAWVLHRVMRNAPDANAVPPVEMARAYANLGQTDSAFEWLEKGYEQRIGALVFLHLEPAWDPIRKDPRFSGLLRRIGIVTSSLVNLRRRSC